MVKSAGSPISKLHLLSIIKEVLEDNPVYTKLARRIIITLFSDQGKIEIQSFFTIMKWVSEDFSSQEDYRQLNPDIKLTLVWHHAHTLLSIFTACGAEYSGLNNIFIQRLNQFPYDMLENKFHYWNDISHPRNLDPLTFILAGLAHARIGDGKDILNEKIMEIINEDSFTSNGGVTIPNSSLWKDSNLANNSMDSFLRTTWTKTLGPILGKKEAKLINEYSNKKKIIAATATLIFP